MGNCSSRPPVVRNRNPAEQQQAPREPLGRVYEDHPSLNAATDGGVDDAPVVTLAQNPPPEQQCTQQRGEMVKLGHLVKNWKKRFFVLRLELGGPQGDVKKSFHLLYYETEEEEKGRDAEGTRPKGDIDLTGATVTAEAGPLTSSSWPAFQFPFRVTTHSNKPYHLRVSGQGEREQWLDALTQAIELNEFLRRPMEFFAASCKSVAQLEAKLATINGWGGVPAEDKELAAATVERIKREKNLPQYVDRYEELATFIGRDVAKQLEDKFSACTCISRRQLQEELTKVQASDKFSPEAKDFAVEVTEKIQAKKQLPHFRNPYEDYASLNAATDGDVDGAPAVLVRLSGPPELPASGGGGPACEAGPPAGSRSGRGRRREEALSLSRRDHAGRIAEVVALAPERKRRVYAPAGL